MATDTTKITGAADELSAGLAKGGSAAKTLGAEIANAIKSLDGRVAALEAGGTQPPITPPPSGGSTDGKITNFSAANSARFQVDGITVAVANANKAWSLVKIDDYTLGFETRSGDTWSSSGGYTDKNCNRSEIEFQDKYNNGQQVTMTEKITILPGPNATASWFTINQLHADSDTPPAPFWFGLDTNGDKLCVVLQQPSGPENYVWMQPQTVERGHEYDFKAVLTLADGNNSRVDVWLDGVQIVNFRGPCGANNTQYYWKVGLYRGEAPETTSVRHKNVHIVVG